MPRTAARSRSKSRVRKRNKTKTRYALVAALAVFFLFFLTLYSFFRQISRSHISADSVSASTFGSGDFYSIALVTSEGPLEEFPVKLASVKVLLLSKNSSIFQVFDMPVDMELDLPGKYGLEPLGSSFALGSMEYLDDNGSCNQSCLGSGMEYVLTSLKKVTGVKVDRWVLAPPEVGPEVENVLMDQAIFSLVDRSLIRDFSNSAKTNLTLADLFHFYSAARGIKSEDIKNRSYSDEAAFDAHVREMVYNSPIAEERHSVAVLNASKTPGMAAYGSRVVQNRGGHVVSVDNASISLEETAIVARDPSSLCARYLADFFDIDRIISLEDSPLNDAVLDRVDVGLVIGLDFVAGY
jgi:hypothetical protein